MMIVRRALLLFLVLSFALPATGCISRGQRVKHQPPEKRIERRPVSKMSIDQVIQWSEQGAPAAEIIDRIEQSRSVFDLDVEKILILREAGVSDRVINVMLRKTAPPGPPTPGAA